jgi:predicted GH43/DUF377 family glycosyl hydrolase
MFWTHHLTWAVALTPAMAAPPVDVGHEKQLFLDGTFTAEANGVTLTVNRPTKTYEKNLVADQPFEDMLIGGFSVLQEDGLYRAYYSAWWRQTPSDTDTRLCMATSTDGIHWTKPKLGLIDFGGNKDNNIVFQSQTGHGYHAGTVFVDPVGPPEARYKLIFLGNDGVRGGYSSDGVHWTEYPEVLIPHGSDTQNVAFYDPRLARYVAYLRLWIPRGRAISRAESEDYLHWTEPQLILAPDEQDPPEVDLYTNAAIPYPDAANAYFIFTSAFDHRGEGPLDVHLAVSRDGVHWTRPSREPFIPRGDEKSFDRMALYCGRGLVTVGDELCLYYGGYDIGHHVNYPNPYAGVMSRVSLRKDGFMSYDAGDAEGRLTTLPLIFSGSRLELNVATANDGQVTVELLSEGGEAIPGFDAAAADGIAGDFLAKTVTWQGRSDLSALRGQPVCLRFLMRKAKLFAFQFAE